MLIYLYLFSLIVGGVLLGASILLGGHDDGDLDGDFDADTDLDVDGDIDADADGDVEGHGHEHAHGHSGSGEGAFGDLLMTFLSLRFWTFFLAFFGLTGIVLDGLNLVPGALIALALSSGMGLVSGFGAVTAIRALSRDTSGHLVTSGEYIGKTARVMVPIRAGATGKVRVEIAGHSVDLLATGIDNDELSGTDEVLIVEMEGAKARVARLDVRGPGRG